MSMLLGLSVNKLVRSFVRLLDHQTLLFKIHIRRRRLGIVRVVLDRRPTNTACLVSNGCSGLQSLIMNGPYLAATNVFVRHRLMAHLMLCCPA